MTAIVTVKVIIIMKITIIVIAIVIMTIAAIIMEIIISYYTVKICGISKNRVLQNAAKNITK